MIRYSNSLKFLGTLHISVAIVDTRNASPFYPFMIRFRNFSLFVHTSLIMALTSFFVLFVGIADPMISWALNRPCH